MTRLYSYVLKLFLLIMILSFVNLFIPTDVISLEIVGIDSKGLELPISGIEAKFHQNKADFDSPEFGPFFLPQGNQLQSISLNYFTRKPTNTIVYFGMTGKIDWVRPDSRLTTYHKMDFPHLEENTVYNFELEIDSPSIQKFSSIQTLPYGRSKQILFGIARLESQIEAHSIPHFQFLLTKKHTVNEKLFESYFLQNSKLYSSTILVPGFDLDLQGNIYRLSDNGAYFFDYQQAHFVFIYRDFYQIDTIIHHLNTNKTHKNYIIMGDISPNLISEITRMYAAYVNGIYSLNPVGIEGVQIIKDYKLIDIILEQ